MRQQTASLPRRIEVKVAQVARRLKKPRRVVLQEAIDEYSARHDPEAITAAMNRVADTVDTHPDEGLASAAHSILERSQW
jgi:predicted transcriptional regulator